eukprot:jgi/Chlat1/6987/Chrsp56S06683
MSSLQSLLKEGHRHLSGLEEAVIKNLEACRQLAAMTRTSLGPHGLQKMVINHLDKLIVTAHAATILRELEVAHPAAKLVAMAAQAQQAEAGDGTNLVLSLAGDLLSLAADLLRDGLHPSEIIQGYVTAAQHTLDLLDKQVIPGSDKIDVRDKTAVEQRIRSAIASKQYGREQILAPLITDACIAVTPKKDGAAFNVDNVRVCKLPGGGLRDSRVVSGVVVRRSPEGTKTHAKQARIAVFASGVDTSDTETKGTVLIESAEQLENYAKSEEAKLEAIVKSIADAGATVVVSGAGIGEMALHFLERYNMLALKITSKFELRRFCKAVNATALVKFAAPSPDELGWADTIDVQEIGGQQVTVVRQDSSSASSIATVVVRGATDNILDDIERAVDDGVNTYKAICKDPKIVPGAGATELEVARQLAEIGRKETGLSQYAIAKFAQALEVVPRTLAENAGLNATEVVSSLYAAHAAGKSGAGVDVEGDNGGVLDDAAAAGIYDLHLVKWWAIKLAADAAVTVLRVDQIIMAKQAGGPKKPSGPGGEDED